MARTRPTCCSATSRRTCNGHGPRARRPTSCASWAFPGSPRRYAPAISAAWRSTCRSPAASGKPGRSPLPHWRRHAGQVIPPHSGSRRSEWRSSSTHEVATPPPSAPRRGPWALSPGRSGPDPSRRCHVHPGGAGESAGLRPPRRRARALRGGHGLGAARPGRLVALGLAQLRQPDAARGRPDRGRPGARRGRRDDLWPRRLGDGAARRFHPGHRRAAHGRPRRHSPT